MKVEIDLSRNNVALYAGCEIKTPIAEAARILACNIVTMLQDVDDQDIVTLVGPAPPWAYFIAFHGAVHRFREVWYDDGENGPVLLTQRERDKTL